MNVQDDFARQIKRVLTDYGVEKKPLGVDMIELSMLRALEKEGIEVVDGQQAMLDARESKTADEIELLKQSVRAPGKTNWLPLPIISCIRWVRSGLSASIRYPVPAAPPIVILLAIASSSPGT